MKAGLSRWEEKDKTGEGHAFANSEWLELLIWMRDTQPSFDKNQWRTGWHAIWRQYQTWLQNNRDACRWASALDEFEIGACTVKPITDDVSLANEGLVMKNCIGSHGGVCKSGEYRVFAIVSSRSQRHIATVGIKKSEDEWQLDQVKGKCNSDVSPGILELAELTLRRYIHAERQRSRQECCSEPLDHCRDEAKPESSRINQAAVFETRAHIAPGRSPLANRSSEIYPGTLL
jgi:hypothetical protein